MRPLVAPSTEPTPGLRTGRRRDRSRGSCPSGDDGVVSVLVGAAIPGLVVFTLVVMSLWSGYAARQHLTQMAEAGARSGANAIDEDRFNNDGVIVLEPDLARLYALETITEHDARSLITGGSIDVTGRVVTVTLEGRLPVVGLPVRASTSAEPRVDRRSG